MFKKKSSILPKHSATYTHSTETLGRGGEKKAEQAFRDGWWRYVPSSTDKLLVDGEKETLKSARAD